MLSKPIPLDPELEALLVKSKNHVMTDEEIDEQRQSFVRGMMARCEHGVLDFEQCPKCRNT